MKGIQKFECCSTAVLRQNHNGNVGKEAVAIGLHDRFAPVPQFHLERKNGRFGFAQESLQGQMRLRFPIDRHNVGDAITIDRDLPGNRHVSAAFTAPLFVGEGSCKMKGKPVLGASPRRMPGKISNRLMKPEFGNRCCHHGYRLESLNPFPSRCQREIETFPVGVVQHLRWKPALDALKEQKRGLMQKLLTGEIRVKVEGRGQPKHRQDGIRSAGKEER